MDESLIAVSDPNFEVLWRHLGRLIDRVHSVLGSATLIDDCLDLLVDALGADRGLVLLTTAAGGILTVNARGQKKALTAEERQQISTTIVARVLQTSECVIWDPLVHEPNVQSFAELGIVAAFAAPIRRSRTAASQGGVLYVDFRERRKFISNHHIEFFKVASVLIGTVVDQFHCGVLTREHLSAAREHRIEAGAIPKLTDLLAPPSMRSIAVELVTAVRSDCPILVLGESGTGKTLLAQSIAEESGRRPIVRAMLGASDDLNTITSELFGHERSAFPGASKRVGLVEYANGGTVIFDEVLNLPLHAQQLLLDFTQFGTYRPLGYNAKDPKHSRVRIIAATNGDLRAAIRERRFREDLYYRLAGVTLQLPPLRVRRDEVPALAVATLRRVDPGKSWTLTVHLRQLLVSPLLEWPGNVRQLERVIERARERALAADPDANTLHSEHVDQRDLGVTLPAEAGSLVPASMPSLATRWQRLQSERERIESEEYWTIQQALEESEGVVARAARELRMARTTLASRIDALGLRVRGGRDEGSPG